MPEGLVTFRMPCSTYTPSGPVWDCLPLDAPASHVARPMESVTLPCCISGEAASSRTLVETVPSATEGTGEATGDALATTAGEAATVAVAAGGNAVSSPAAMPSRRIDAGA